MWAAVVAVEASIYILLAEQISNSAKMGAQNDGLESAVSLA